MKRIQLISVFSSCRYQKFAPWSEPELYVPNRVLSSYCKGSSENPVWVLSLIFDRDDVPSIFSCWSNFRWIKLHWVAFDMTPES